MASELSLGLSELHQRLQELESAEGRLAEGPRRIRLAQKQVAAAELATEQQKEEITRMRKAADGYGLQLKTRESELLKLEGLLNQAKSNKEYEIVKGQIAAAQKARESLEGEALEAMEQVDAAQARLKELKQTLESTQADLKKLEASVAAERPGLEESVAAVQGKIAEAEKIIPGGDHTVTWKRIRGAHGAAALSQIDEGFCSFCSSRVTTQDLVRINTGEFLLCRECGRVLYNL